MNRLEILKERESKANEYQTQIADKLDDFQNLGKKLFSTKDGREFFLLAKEIYGDTNEYLRDNFIVGDPLQIARLNGEDYILRKIIMQFINSNNK